MRVLGIETATRVCSVALAEAGQVLVDYTLNVGAHHAERLMPMVERVLADAKMGVRDLDGVGVSCGPGSFTGLRIGMSTAKGLCFASGLPLLAVPTLEALALGAACGAMPVCAVLDARRGEVYAGVYRREGQGLTVLKPDAALALDRLLADVPRPAVFVGDGAVVYEDRIREGLEGAAYFPPGPFNRPGAAAVAILGAARLQAGAVETLAEAEPRYLRRSQAERVRESQAHS